MQSNIFDKNGVEVKIGDILSIPYIDPMGKIHDAEDFKVKVVFKYGCFGYYTETKFIPLFNWIDKKQGEYIANCGNKTIYIENYPFWVSY